MYFSMFAEDLSAFDNALLQDHEVLLQQDQVGRLLGDVSGSIHRDADIRRPQRRSVVNSVAHESDNVPFAPKDADDPLFVCRRQASE